MKTHFIEINDDSFTPSIDLFLDILDQSYIDPKLKFGSINSLSYNMQLEIQNIMDETVKFMFLHKISINLLKVTSYAFTYESPHVHLLYDTSSTTVEKYIVDSFFYSVIKLDKLNKFSNFFNLIEKTNNPYKLHIQQKTIDFLDKYNNQRLNLLFFISRTNKKVSFEINDKVVFDQLITKYKKNIPYLSLKTCSIDFNYFYSKVLEVNKNFKFSSLLYNSSLKIKDKIKLLTEIHKRKENFDIIKYIENDKYLFENISTENDKKDIIDFISSIYDSLSDKNKYLSLKFKKSVLNRKIDTLSF